MEIVTEKENSYPKNILEQNAIDLIMAALDEYDCEPWNCSLRENIINTLKNQNRC